MRLWLLCGAAIRAGLSRRRGLSAWRSAVGRVGVGRLRGRAVRLAACRSAAVRGGSARGLTLANRRCAVGGARRTSRRRGHLRLTGAALRCAVVRRALGSEVALR